MMKKYFLVLAVASQLGCSSSEKLRNESEQSVADMGKGPKAAPYRTITNFSGAVRCMDSLLSTYGVKDISILVEDLDDSTKKATVGTRDMLLSTMSEMTRRSRAIRFIAYGGDQKNIVSFLAAADNKRAYASIPQYGIRGSISQFDDNVVKKTNDVGLGITDFLTLGISSSATAKLLGLDLSIINTTDLSLVPGVISKNSVAIFSQGDGIDSEARFKKLGVNYATSLARSEGTSVAVRNLIELASVELIGKLTKVPYWSCLGSSTKNKDIQQEVEDWFEGMANNPSELFFYFQYQLALRGVYNGPVNGVPTPNLSIAIKQYKAGLGMTPDSNLNADFMLAYLGADHDVVATRLEKMNRAHASRLPINMSLVQSGEKKALYKKKESIKLELSVNMPAYVYCYLLDANNLSTRIFPNQFSGTIFHDGDKPLALPDTSKYILLANAQAKDEKVVCYGTHKDVLPATSEAMRIPDLVPLGKSVSSESIRREFTKLGGEGWGAAEFIIHTDPKSK